MSRDYFIEWRIVFADPETAEPGERYADPGWGAGTRVTFPSRTSSVDEVIHSQYNQLLGQANAINEIELRRVRRICSTLRRFFLHNKT